MGSIYDLENIKNNPRCVDVKPMIVIINLAGAPLSFLLLIVCIIRMARNKKKSFITYIIFFIFFSEIMNTISKMLQLVKYIFRDTRMDNNPNSIETPRGIICQIQIVTSIFSDFCSLLGTLLLSFRCYDLIKNKKKFFDKKKRRIISICLIICFSLIASISFLFIDRTITRKSVTYKFDLRDRCCYWCWLDHFSSLICYSLYLIILIFIIIYACKTNSFLKQKSKNILEQSVVFMEKSNDNNTEKNEDNKTNQEEKGMITKEDKQKVKDVTFMRIKVLTYPWVGIIIWGLSTVYRVTDDIIMSKIDYIEENEREKGTIEEQKLFAEHPGFQFFVELFMVFHTILSSFRGILYGLSFIIFEDKCFGKYFRKCTYDCCCKNEDLEKYDDMEENNESDSTGISAEGILIESKASETNENDKEFRPSHMSNVVILKNN